MRTPRVMSWFLTCVLAVLASGPAVAQSLVPDAAIPAGPNNPFVPPQCTGTVFTDVTCSTTFDPWIEQFSADAITGGCGGGLYCPTGSVTRAQMAVFIEKAMRGTAAWSPGNLGNKNTGLGNGALLHNTIGSLNTAVGDSALFTQSFDNGGSGWFGPANTAVGFAALYSNEPTNTSNGAFNTSVGVESLYFNTTGSANTAVGALSLNVSQSASHNTAIGTSSLGIDTTGFDNTAIGWEAGTRDLETITGYNGSPVMLVGNQTGNYNTFIGITGATAQVDNCTAVGMDAYCDATNQVRLGNVFVTSIGGKVGWSALSDARAKSDIRDLDLGLPFVLALRPVSYRYRGGNGRTDMGFVGQDVEALLGERYNLLDVGGDADRTLSLRYTDLIAPLVKAVQEQQAEIAALKARLAEIDELRARVSELMAQREPNSRIPKP